RADRDHARDEQLERRIVAFLGQLEQRRLRKRLHRLPDPLDHGVDVERLFWLHHWSRCRRLTFWRQLAASPHHSPSLPLRSDRQTLTRTIPLGRHPGPFISPTFRTKARKSESAKATRKTGREARRRCSFIRFLSRF